MRDKIFGLFLFVFLIRDAYAEHETRNLKQFQEYFQDTLLVIFYANPHFETIDFIKQLYSPVFKNIVFYGDRTEHVSGNEWDHVNEEVDHGQYRIIYTGHGYYLSRWIKDALLNYPGYSGYIFMQDDCVMHFWNFLNLDKNKIWFNATAAWHVDYEERPADRCMTINQATDSLYTGWFNTEAGMPRMKEVFSRLPELGLDEEKAMLSANFGENGAAWYMVDFFYLPSRLTGKMIRLCDLFDRVFCEISIPTMLGAIEDRHNWEDFSFWWTCFDSGSRLIEAYNPQYYWMHPLKYSYEQNRDFVSKMFHEHFYDTLDIVD